MATTTTRLIRIPQLGDVPDVPADMNRMATDLDSRLIWSQGTLAARPATPSPNLSGTVYWATDDFTQGPNGSASYWDGGAWRDWVGNSPSVGQKAALAGTAGTPNGTTNKYVTATDSKLGLSVSSAVQVRDVGEVNQIRAGRVLTAADFTNMGLSAPLALWNLGNVNDSSGNARALTNKGTVPFGLGITGTATEAAVFAGSTAQALYIVSAAWQQITVGSIGFWMRTAKKGVAQSLISKTNSALTDRQFHLSVDTSNVASANIAISGTPGAWGTAAIGVTDIADDRWHFIGMSVDGTKLRLYVDGVLEGMVPATGLLNASAGPLTIGGYGADGATAAGQPMFGRVDEAFLLGEILSEEQFRNLYCVRISHSLSVTPSRARVGVRRRRRGGNLLTTDFPSTPLRLYNFTAGAVTDAGSNGTSVAAGGGGTISDVAGADGLTGNAKNFAGAHTGLISSDSGLPSGTATRSYGLWVKTTAVGPGVMVWGTPSTADAALTIAANGTIQSTSGADAIAGPVVSDGGWHSVIVVEENAPTDGVKRKLYFDGRLVGGSTVLTSLTLVGAGGFKIGTRTVAMVGQTDGVFVIGVALTPEQVKSLYNLGSQSLAVSPKSEGEHIEAIEATSILAVFDGIEGCDTIDLQVSA